MPFSVTRKQAAPAAAGETPSEDSLGGKKSGSDLLIRFFESAWFDAYICVTYLYKSNSPGVQDYLCNRLYTLPERDVERYLSQLTQLCIQRPGSLLERVVTDLCAHSLRIAVKAYWLLLAISQDQPKDGNVVALRDACEQAALQGQWQLPFKHSRLPPPLSISPAKFHGGGLATSGQPTPIMLSPNGSFTHLLRPVFGTSPDPRRIDSWPMSPGDSRPLSPDGLGGGMYSSVFMDTGVEGLLYSDPSADDELRETRQHLSSPRHPHGLLLEGPGRPLLPLRVDLHRASGGGLQQQEHGDGGGLSGLSLRSSGTGDGDAPALAATGRSAVANGGGASLSGSVTGAGLLSPPNSPRRRQTTFGATLDFVETLCQASSSLTAFQPDDRQWALRRALQQINVEIEKASRNGVAIWYPLGEGGANLRVVRLAARESRLLNSREKAPFTLCVEVLDEEVAAAVMEAKAARLAAVAEAAKAAAAAAAAAVKLAEDASSSGGSSGGQYADSARSVLMEQPPPAAEDLATAAAAAEAARSGIPFFPNHHRTQSMDTISTSSSSLETAALAAVQASSAITGDAVGAAQPLQRLPSSIPSSIPSASGSPHGSGHSAGLSAEPSFAGMLAGHAPASPLRDPEGTASGGAAAAAAAGAATAAAAAGRPPGVGGSPARPRRLAEDLDAVSDVPSFSEGDSALGSPATQAADEGEGLLTASASRTSVLFEPSPSPQQHQQPQQPTLQQQAAQQQSTQQQQAASRRSQLPPLNLPPKHSGKVPGAGTWIGGSSPLSSPGYARAAGASGTMALQQRMSSSLETALAGLRGEAPLVQVRLEVLNDTPLNSSRSSSSTGTPLATQQHAQQQQQQQQQQLHSAPGTPDASILASLSAASAERRRLGTDAAVAARASHQCDRNSWACKLGLCKLCNAKLATMGDDDGDPRLQPTVRVHFTVQGGVDLSIRRTPARHQRMPSHEALLKVAKQHKLPAPVLPSPLAPPTQQNVAQAQALPWETQLPSGPFDQQQQQQQPQLGQLPGGGAACLPVWKPAGPAGSHQPAAGAGGPLTASALASEDMLRRVAAEAAYGERWSARKDRVQAASPHGRRPGWDLRCVIVKTGDDCRQELLAMQLIRAFHEIFAEAQLPLWLRPYEVLPTSNRTALIEMVPNAPSIHALKSKHAPGVSLREHMLAKFGGAGSPAFYQAQRCFVESLAGYSLVCYLLQIKDRHNGNILLDDEGHLIHIDFGFMLSNSPGGVNFESAPFKLTRELLEVMDSNSEGHASELFDYFKVLMIQGFLALRKHADRILLLVEMMQGSGCPCFKNRLGALQGLKKRFNLALPEPQLVEAVLGLISDSLDAWRTRQYDYYQRVLNGIL